MSETMVVYFADKTLDCQIPDHVLREAKSIFTRFEVRTHIDGTVEICAPDKEVALVQKFRDDVFSLLVELRKENDVLAGKLARQYVFGSSLSRNAQY